jgi:hypothetical protein
VVDVQSLYTGILKPNGGLVGNGSSPFIDTTNAMDVSRWGLGMGNGSSTGTPKNFVDSSGTANITVTGEKQRAGADNGMGWAIDWFGNGEAVSGNPGLVDKDDGNLGSVGQLSAGLIEGASSMIARVAIIILGFVFVAAGLAMFKDSGVNVNVVKTVASAL